MDARADKGDLFGKSALAHALRNGDVKIALLLDAGADKDVRDVDGKCSLSPVRAASAGIRRRHDCQIAA